MEVKLTISPGRSNQAELAQQFASKCIVLWETVVSMNRQHYLVGAYATVGHCNLFVIVIYFDNALLFITAAHGRSTTDLLILIPWRTMQRCLRKLDRQTIKRLRCRGWRLDVRNLSKLVSGHWVTGIAVCCWSRATVTLGPF